MYERFNTYSTTRPRLRKTVGWFLVVIGFLALVTPLTPGAILFFVGLELLGMRARVVERLTQFVRRRKGTSVIEVAEQV
jgi:uncharacterized protein YqgC (DUF456 family)